MNGTKDIDWIFFDIGGVLTDDRDFEAARDRVVLEALASLTVRLDDDAFTDARRRASARTGDLTINLVEELVADPRLADGAKAKAQLLWRQLPNRSEMSRVRPGLGPILEQLAKRYRLGIMANQPADTREKLLGAGVLQHFSHVGVSEDYGFHKPDPRLFKEVLRVTGAAAERSVMIDDNLERGLLPAKKLGFRTVWLTEDATPPAPNAADWTISKLEEVVELFP